MSLGFWAAMGLSKNGGFCYQRKAEEQEVGNNCVSASGISGFFFFFFDKAQNISLKPLGTRMLLGWVGPRNLPLQKKETETLTSHSPFVSVSSKFYA